MLSFKLLLSLTFYDLCFILGIQNMFSSVDFVFVFFGYTVKKMHVKVLLHN